MPGGVASSKYMRACRWCAAAAAWRLMASTLLGQLAKSEKAHVDQYITHRWRCQIMDSQNVQDIAGNNTIYTKRSIYH